MPVGGNNLLSDSETIGTARAELLALFIHNGRIIGHCWATTHYADNL